MNFVGNFYAISPTLSTSPFQEILADRVECIDQADVGAERLNGMRYIGGNGEQVARGQACFFFAHDQDEFSRGHVRHLLARVRVRRVGG